MPAVFRGGIIFQSLPVMLLKRTYQAGPSHRLVMRIAA